MNKEYAIGFLLILLLAVLTISGILFEYKNEQIYFLKKAQEEERKLERNALYNDIKQIESYIQSVSTRKLSENFLWELSINLYYLCKDYNVDPRIVVAMIHQESKFDPASKGKDGERGLLQVLPSTFRLLNGTDLNDWHETLEIGIKYYKYLEQKFEGNVALAVAAYNAGPGRIEDAGYMIPAITSTQNHVKKVMLTYRGLHR